MKITEKLAIADTIWKVTLVAGLVILAAHLIPKIPSDALIPSGALALVAANSWAFYTLWANKKKKAS